MNQKWLLIPLLAAAIASIVYLVFAFVAFLNYPGAYSPLTNWLSDLGNPTVNPSGALYYNIGGVVTSSVLILFFISIYSWKLADKKMKIFLGLSQVVGLVLAVAFMTSALFPLGVNNSIHSVASITLFISIGLFEIFSVSAIRKNPSHAKWLPAFGISVALVNFGLAVSFNFSNFFVGEWIMIALFIAWMLTLAVTQKSNALST